MASIMRDKRSEGSYKLPLHSCDDRLRRRIYVIKRTVASLTMSLVLLVTAGCVYTAYDGAWRPSDQVAILEGWQLPEILGIYFFLGPETYYPVGFDEKNITAPSLTFNIQLLPGWHTVRLEHRREGMLGSLRHGSIQIFAEAGHVYEVHAEKRSRGGLRSWITDKSSGQIIADVTQPSVEVIRAYEGPERSSTEIAVIKGSVLFWRSGCENLEACYRSTLISLIDEKWEVAEHWPDFVQVELLPGLRKVSLISLQHSDLGAGYTANLQFIAQPGHTYQAHNYVPHSSNAPARFWIEDIETEEVVAETSCSRQSDGNEQPPACSG